MTVETRTGTELFGGRPGPRRVSSPADPSPAAVWVLLATAFFLFFEPFGRPRPRRGASGRPALEFRK